jgi:hypothetical protein
LEKRELFLPLLLLLFSVWVLSSFLSPMHHQKIRSIFLTRKKGEKQ